MKCPQATASTAIRARRCAQVATVPILLSLIAAAIGGCVYDPKNPCGAHQVNYMDGARCVCEPTAVWTATGCVPCGTNEVPGATGCVCTAGFARPSADAACAAIPSGLGTACDATTPCADPTSSYCEMGSASAGYCTKTGCSGPSDCEGGYGCDTKVTPTVCRRPPVGYGKACTSAADCAGTEATYCDTYQTKSCIVEGCTVAPNNCFVGTACCDLTKFGVPKPICVPEGGCP